MHKNTVDTLQQGGRSIYKLGKSPYNSSFLTKKYKLTLAVVNVEIALVEMKTAQVEVDAQIQIRTSRYEIAKVKVEVQHMLNHFWIFPTIQFLFDYLCFELGFLFGQF